MSRAIELAPGAEDNGLASMLAELVRQNLEQKPHKLADFHALDGSVAILAEDIEVALTLRFGSGRLMIHDGIVGIPDVAIRAQSDTILALSTMPLTSPLALPVPMPKDQAGKDTMKSVWKAMRDGSFEVSGMAGHFGMLLHLTRIMSVYG